MTENSIFKEKNEDLNMTWQLVVGGVLIVLFVYFLFPVVDVLTVNVPLPPEENNIVLIQTKITLWQQYQTNVKPPTNTSKGDTKIIITLLDSEYNEKFKGFYSLGDGNWRINTFQPISRSDNVIIDIPYYGITPKPTFTTVFYIPIN